MNRLQRRAEAGGPHAALCWLGLPFGPLGSKGADPAC